MGRVNTQKHMGEMADYYLDRMFDDMMCIGCGADVDWCRCDGPRPQKLHAEGCEGKEVVRTNSKTNVQFIGCSAFPKCKFSRTLYYGEGI